MSRKKFFRRCFPHCLSSKNDALVKKHRASRKKLPSKRSPSPVIVPCEQLHRDIAVGNGTAASKENDHKFLKPTTTAREYYESFCVHSVQVIQKEFLVHSQKVSAEKKQTPQEKYCAEEQAAEKIEKSKKNESNSEGKEKEAAGGGKSLMDLLQCKNFEVQETKPMNSNKLAVSLRANSVYSNKGETKKKIVDMGGDRKLENKKRRKAVAWPIFKQPLPKNGWYPMLETIPELPSPLEK